MRHAFTQATATVQAIRLLRGITSLTRGLSGFVRIVSGSLYKFGAASPHRSEWRPDGVLLGRPETIWPQVVGVTANVSWACNLPLPVTPFSLRVSTKKSKATNPREERSPCLCSGRRRAACTNCSKRPNQESNLKPAVYKTAALPVELFGRRVHPINGSRSLTGGPQRDSNRDLFAPTILPN